MLSAKQLEFQRWAAELDYRCEHPPILFAFHHEADRALTMKESVIVQGNLASYARSFVGKTPCANPDCRFPLADDEGFYVAEYGRCCWLCHDMDGALRQTTKGVHYGTIFEWFYTAHKQWKSEQDRIKKIRNREDQGGLL
jgi:hypothetical protein